MNRPSTSLGTSVFNNQTNRANRHRSPTPLPADAASATSTTTTAAGSSANANQTGSQAAAPPRTPIHIDTQYGYDAAMAYINSQDAAEREMAVCHLHIDIFSADIDQYCGRARQLGQPSQRDTEQQALESSPEPSTCGGSDSPTLAGSSACQSARPSSSPTLVVSDNSSRHRDDDSGVATPASDRSESHGLGIDLAQWMAQVEPAAAADEKDNEDDE